MPSLHASCRAPVFAWIVFLLVCGTITGLKLWQNRIEHERLVVMMRLTALSRIPFPHRPPLWSEGEAARRAVRTWGAWAWVAVLVAAGVSQDRRRSRLLAHVLLANAMVVALAVALSPNATPRRAGEDQLLWLIGSVLMLAASAFVLRHAMTTRSRDDTFCQTCGYDLRGNVSGICPECGTPAPPLAASRTITG